MGFKKVYDYVGSKVEWMGADLPWEGSDKATLRLGDIVRGDAPTCLLAESVADIRNGLAQCPPAASRASTAWPFALVVNEVSVVLGLVRAEALATNVDGIAVRDLMQEGPSTYRPDVTAKEMADRLAANPETHVIVTTLDGRLCGVVEADRITAAVEPNT